VDRFKHRPDRVTLTGPVLNVLPQKLKPSSSARQNNVRHSNQNGLATPVCDGDLRLPLGLYAAAVGLALAPSVSDRIPADGIVSGRRLLTRHFKSAVRTHRASASLGLILMPGPIVELSEIFLMYVPFEPVGLAFMIASTKAFTSQLVALYLLALRLGQARGALSLDQSREHVNALVQLPLLLEQTLQVAPDMEDIAEAFERVYGQRDALTHWARRQPASAH